MHPLVSAPWLAERLEDPYHCPVDVRWYLADPAQGRREYEAGHIPGAVFFDVETDLSAAEGPGRHPLPESAAFAETLGRAGIGNRHTVVAYDNSGGAIAARLWWMLRHVGHDSVAVLDGGWPAWVSAGLPESTDLPSRPPAEFSISERTGDLIDRETLRGQLGSIRLLDARASERYEGRIEPVDPAAGHIPTALSFPHDGNLAGDGRFLDAAALRRRYGDEVGPAVAYCGSGVTACHTVLAHVVAGLPKPRLYAGSWSDWAGAGLEVAVGPEPGSP